MTTHTDPNIPEGPVHHSLGLDGWKETTLGEVTEKIGDGLHGTPIYSIDGEYFFINGNNIDNGKIIIKEDTKRVSQEEYEKYKKDLNQKTILLGINGTVGNLAKYRNEKCILGKSAAYLNINEEVDKNFMYYLMLDNTFQYSISKNANGSTIKNVGLAQLRSYTFSLPPAPEQRAIADILLSFDAKIELLSKQNETLEKTAQMIFHEWFGKYSIENPEELPEGWRVGKLGDEFDISIGRTPPRLEFSWFSEVPVGKKWISIRDIGNCGTYIFETAEYLTDDAIKKFNIPIIPKNTTILSFKMTVGKLTITTEPMLSNEAIAHLKIRDNSYLTSEYIYCYLQLLDFNALGSTSSIVTAINSTMIKELNFIIPNKKILLDFQEIIQVIFRKIYYNSLQIQSLTKARDELLPRLMSGEVRVEV